VTGTLVALLVGAVLGAAWWQAAGEAMGVSSLARTNHRGAVIPTAAGIVVPLAVAAAAAVAAVGVAQWPSWAGEWTALASTTVLTTAGFGLLGLFDDLVGVGQSGGFRGHLRALVAGRLTSGAIKLLGGAALGVVVASRLPSLDPAGPAGIAVLRDGAIVALAANLVNLFDRRPGRALKVATGAFVVAAAVSRSAALAVPAVGVGAGIGVLWPDLRERCMLGDTGANALGATCGLALLVAAPSGVARWVALAALLGLNLLSELVSFSRIIDAVPPLRWVDRAGTLRAG
jgi:UDP-GlcNAc:undecaprenyl-phosphate/decaprenyl-phosphate GlcNAc-1-phosphate transferase